MTARPPRSQEAAIEQTVHVFNVIGSTRHRPDPVWLRRFVEISVRRAWRPAGVARQIWAIGAHGDRTPLLSRIVAPTAIIHGSDDPLVRVAAAHDLHRKIAGAEIRIIDGMGHDLPPQLAAGFAQSIIRVAARATVVSKTASACGMRYIAVSNMVCARAALAGSNSSLAWLNLHGPQAAGQSIFTQGFHRATLTRYGRWLAKSGCRALMKRNREEDCDGRQADRRYLCFRLIDIRARKGQRFQMDAIVDSQMLSASIDVQMIDVGGQQLQVAITRGPRGRPPLLMFNGIGANWELAKPFLTALKQTEAIIFDIPGVGGSPLPSFPYRPSTIARLAMGLVEKLGHEQVDVAGVSWGGALAQQFAHQYDKACRKLVLAATSPGTIMVPGRPSVLWKLATPRRYFDKGFMRNIASSIYGGDFRKDPQLIVKYAQAMSGANGLGYFYQLLAMTGWTSLPWLWSLKQPTLVMAGADDPIVPLANGRVLARLIPNARLETIDDGHLFMVTRPDETAAIIEAFLAE